MTAITKLFWVVAGILVPTLIEAAEVGGRTSMAAESPFTSYTASVVAYVLLTGLLVATLLIGGLLAVNLGFMSKRNQDRRGGRAPSEVAILKNSMWPTEASEEPILPADVDENHYRRIRARERQNQGSSRFDDHVLQPEPQESQPRETQPQKIQPEKIQKESLSSAQPGLTGAPADSPRVHTFADDFTNDLVGNLDDEMQDKHPDVPSKRGAA